MCTVSHQAPLCTNVQMSSCKFESSFETSYEVPHSNMCTFMESQQNPLPQQVLTNKLVFTKDLMCLGTTWNQLRIIQKT